MKYEPHQPEHRRSHSLVENNGLKGLAVGLMTGLILSGCNNPFAATNQPSPTPTTSPTPPGSPTNSPSPFASPAATDKPEATRNLETQLQSTVSQAINTPLQSIDCPARPAFQAGDRFDCQATTNNQSFGVSVAITDASGQFEWQTKGLVQLPKLEQFIQQQVQEKGGGEVKASCGGAVRVVKPGDSFDCQVTNAQGQSRTTRVTVKDDQGTVDVSLI